MKFIKKLRIHVGYFLIWLVTKLQLWMLNYAFQLQLLAWRNVNLNVRLSDPDALQEGFHKHRDMIFHIATNKITNPEWFDSKLSENWKRKPHDDFINELSSLVSDYISNRDEVNHLIDKATSNSNVKKWLTIHLRIRRYIETDYSYSTDNCKIEYLDSRLAELGDTAKPIIASDIGKLISQAKQDLKDSRFALSDREAFKISLNLKWIGSIISLLSVLLLISGFIYTYTLYTFFGVPVSLYFSVSDYVDSSIEQLYTVFFGVFFGILAAFLGAHQTSRTPTIIVEKQRKRPDFFLPVVWASILLFTFVGLFIGGRALHSNISWIIFFTGMLVTPYLAKQFFNERARAIFLLFTVFAFTSRMYDTVYSNIYDILERESVPRLCEQINITSDDNGFMPPCGSSVAGATEEHIFIFNQNKNVMVILPRSRLTQSEFDSSLVEEIWVNRLSNWFRDWVSSRLED